MPSLHGEPGCVDKGQVNELLRVSSSGGSSVGSYVLSYPSLSIPYPSLVFMCASHCPLFQAGQSRFCTGPTVVPIG